jgi:hypothetical protein
MTGKQVFAVFQCSAPDFTKDKVEAWFPYGENTIRLRLRNRQQFVYTITKEGYNMCTLSEHLSLLRLSRKEKI